MKNRYRIICASYLLLVKEGKILMSRRFNTGYEDGKYSLPAGHVDEGESVGQTLIREAREEIGIDIRKGDMHLVHVMHRNGSDRNDERLDLFFVCEKWDGEIVNLEPDKCDDLSWFELDNLPGDTIPYIRQVIENSFKGVTYSELNW